MCSLTLVSVQQQHERCARTLSTSLQSVSPFRAFCAYLSLPFPYASCLRLFYVVPDLTHAFMSGRSDLPSSPYTFFTHTNNRGRRRRGTGLPDGAHPALGRPAFFGHEGGTEGVAGKCILTYCVMLCLYLYPRVGPLANHQT